MIDEELLNKFDRIQDLPVSEEMLGAYLEGNLDTLEKLYVENEIISNDNLAQLANEDYNLDAEIIGLPFDVDFDMIDLPIDFDNANINDPMAGTYNYDDLSDLKIFGEPGTPAGTPNPMINQFYADTCAIRSQQIILRDYGIDISQEDLVHIANENGWYAPGQGTPMECVGNLLEIAGVSCHQSENNTIFDLTNELAQGHRIIVGVDSGELWADNFYDKLSEKFEDFMGGGGADHALIVAGVEVNPNNPSDVKVVLTDPGNGNLRVEYSLEEFVDAWKDSNCFMVSTDAPAPYQFDPITNSEIPSGFSTDFAYNGFVIDHGYQLSPGNFTIPEYLTNTYSEEFTIQFPGIDSYASNDSSFNDHGFDLGIDFDEDLI